EHRARLPAVGRMTDELRPAMSAPAEEAPVGAVADEPPPSDGGDVELLRLIDRLAALLDRSDLTELDVESGGTGLVLRKPSALAPITVASVSATSPAATTRTVPSPA